MRCFVAIELSDGIRKQLAALQRRHTRLDRDVKWVRPDQIHLTLKFLGEVPDADVPALCDALKAVAADHEPIEFGVKSTGCFPPGGGARVFWVGVDEPAGALVGLQQACETAYEQFGFAPEGRDFTPHLTLARVKNPKAGGNVRDAAKAEAQFDAGRQTATELILFQSILSPQGPTYIPVARALLGKSR